MDVINVVLSNHSLQFYLILIARLALACILGGIIGYERESLNRPAGFRTHILVCVGAALVMVTSEFILKEYRGIANADPARLGAQVISGIGFLGAGTIIREGYNVRGLTTAASLWAVSCVGIAAGIGFFEGAIAATIIIYLTLILLKKIEGRFSKHNRFKVLYVNVRGRSELVGAITDVFGRNNIEIQKIDFINHQGARNVTIKFLVRRQGNVDIAEVVNQLYGVNGVLKVYES